MSNESIIDDFIAQVTSKLTDAECEALAKFLEVQESRAIRAETELGNIEKPTPEELFEKVLGKMSRLNLVVEENGESELAEKIRDNMDPLWHALTEEQQDHIGLVSEAIQQYYDLGQPTLKLYRLTTSEQLDKFNTFNSVIVCACSEADACKMDPRLFQWPGRDGSVYSHSWAQDTANVTAYLIGSAHKDIQPGVYMVSFNAERPSSYG